MTISLKPLDREDKDGWLELWQRFLENYVENASAHLTFSTFDKLVAKEHSLRSRIALDENRRIVGFIHDFLHVSTWQTRETCFIEDLYVAKDIRRQGIRRQLLDDVARVAGINRWSRMYMAVPSSDETARSFFERVSEEKDWGIFDHKL
jgi:GNAT superfamily N-acetyltransferase